MNIKNVSKGFLSDVMCSFLCWFNKPLTKNQVILMYISWLIGILILVFG